MSDRAIVLFDGVCNLCNGTVTFLIERDRKDAFRFGTLQSDAGRGLLERCPEHHVRREGAEPGMGVSRGGDPDSIVLFEDGRCYTRSTAALRIARRLGGAYALLYGFIVVPRGIRDAVYDWVARNRYRWFGRREACMMPTPELRKKFVEQS